MINKNSHELSFSENNKNYTFFNSKKDLDYLYGRLNRKKQLNNFNGSLYNTSFKNINKINLKRQNQNNSKKIFDLMKRKDSIHNSLCNYGNSSFRKKIINSTEKISQNSNSSNINSYKTSKCILPDISNKSKEINNYLNYSSYNKSLKDIYNASSLSFVSKSSIRTNFLLKEIYLNDPSNNGSLTERTNNTSNIIKFTSRKRNNINFLRKIILHKSSIKNNLNRSQQNKRNKSNLKYIVPQENNKIYLNSLAVKTLSKDFFPNNEQNKNDNIIIMHDIDLKLKELLEKKKLNNSIKNEEEEENQKKEYFKKLANFFDSIPSIIIRKNYNKKKINLEFLYDNYLESINKKDYKIDAKKKIQLPIIRYLFLRKILNTLTHKIDYTYSNFIKKSEVVLNNLDNEELNKKIKDFITYGYEYIPENLIHLKGMKSIGESLKDKEFIKIISNTYINLENIINNLYNNSNTNNKKDGIADSPNEITSSYLFDDKNLNLYFKFLKNHLNKTKTKNKFFMIDKSTNANINNKNYTNFDILSEFRKILYRKANKINKNHNLDYCKTETEANDNIKKENDKRIEKKELIWQNLINSSNMNINKKFKRNDNIYHIKKTIRKIKTLKDKSRKNKKNIFNTKSKKKRIKSSKLYIEQEIDIKENGEIKEDSKETTKINIIKKAQKNKVIKTFGPYKNKFNKVFNNYNIKRKNNDNSKINSDNRLKIDFRSKNSENKYLNLPKIKNKKDKKSKKTRKNKLLESNEYDSIDINDYKVQKENDNNSIINNEENNKTSNNKNTSLENICPFNTNNDNIESIKTDNNNNNKKEENEEKANEENENSIKNIIYNFPNYKKYSKEKRYYDILKKIVTTINFDFADSGISILKIIEKNNKSDDNTINNGISNNNSTEHNIIPNNKDYKIKANQNTFKVVKRELNLFDKFIIEYRKKLYYERELHKANQKISKILDEEDKKANKFKKKYLRAKNRKYTSLFHLDNQNLDSEDKINEEEDKEEKNKKRKKVGRTHFIGINLNSWKDIERKKMEILYKIKHDIKYKIMRGEINLSEMDNFNNFQLKINDLKKQYENFNIVSYVKQLEEFFSSFEEEISKNERKKYDEDRINNFLRRLKDDFNDNDRYRKIYEEKLCKVIDFNEINKINTLNDANKEENQK